MALTVRKALGCTGLQLLSLAVLLPMLGTQTSFSQTKEQTPQQTNARIEHLAQETQPAAGEIPVGPGDLLHIDVFDVADLSRDVRVGETGLISLPLIPQRVPVAGCTPYQLGNRIGELLRENGLVLHPDVTVTVREQNSQPISVVGSVRHPMVYQAYKPTTLLEVLAAADGVADDAGNYILITRSKAPPQVCGEPDPPPSPGEVETTKIRISDLLQTGDPAFNVAVTGGDVIRVPRGGIIYVAGSVASPGGYTLSYAGETMNTMKIIALAHGLQGTAKANSAVILRKDPATGQTKTIRVKLKKIMDRKAPDVTLYANDILYVPDSVTRRVLSRAGNAAVGITTGLIIFRAGQ